jgi:hypothetical protein
MPRVGFKPTIPVFEWAKTVHVLDRMATVMGTEEMHDNDKPIKSLLKGKGLLPPVGLARLDL